MKNRYSFIALMVFSVVMRMVFMKVTWDGPGDGPNRALQAYAWSLHPHVVACEYYPPGYEYVNGIANMLIHEPFYVVRVLNAIWGSLTVGIVFLLSLRVFGYYPALLACLLLAVMPINVGVSMSSLSEPLGLLFLLSCVFYLMKGTDTILANGKVLNSSMTISAIAFVLGSSVRCENWIYAPALLLYFWFKTRKTLASFALAIVYALFPIYWMTSCYLDSGLPLISLGGKEDFRNQGLNLLLATMKVAFDCFLFAGPILQIAGLLGIILFAKRMGKTQDRAWWDQALFVALTLEVWLLMIFAGTQWGFNMEVRMYVGAFDFGVPFASWCLIDYIPYFKKRITDSNLKNQILGFAILTFITMDTMLGVFALFKPYIYIGNTKPTELYAAADWFKASGNEHKSVIFTGLNYRSYFIPLMNPALAEHYKVCIHWYTRLLSMADDCAKDPPEYLVIGEKDSTDLSDILSVVQFKLEKQPVFNGAYFTIYKIVPGSVEKLQHPKLENNFWYPTEPCMKTLFMKPKTIEQLSTH